MSTTFVAQAAPQPRISIPFVFWSSYMARVDDAGMSWPGFSYSESEMTRMRALAEHVRDSSIIKFQLWTAAIFIALAAVAIAVLFAFLTWLYPDPARTPAYVFVCILAMCCFITIGFGVPAAMALASRLSAGGVDLSGVAPDARDAALAAKIRFQCWRMTAIMCGVFIPGALLWIAFDIQAGPVITALKTVSIAIMAFSVWFSSRRPSRDM